MNPALKRLIDDGFVPFTFSKIITEIRKNGEEKKKLVGMISWEKVNKTNYLEYINSCDQACAVKCGKESAITVLDFDDKAEFERALEEHPELKNCRTIKTNKGAHLYFKYTDKIGTTTDGFKSYKAVDIRNDDSIVFAPPTFYKLKNGTTVKYEDLGGELMELPDYLIQDAKCNMKTVVNEPIKKESTKKQKTPSVTANLKYIDEAITSGNLNMKALGSWDDWRDVGFIIHNTSNDEKGRELFHKFSKINKDKYDEKYTDEWWATINQKTETPMTIQTMKKWLGDGLKFVTNEKQAADIMFDRLKDILKSYKNRLFMLRDNIWIHDNETIFSALTLEIMNSGIYQKGDDDKIKAFAQNVGKAKNIREALVARVLLENNDEELYAKFHSSTKAKLCFNDGVLDFKNRSFTLWENIEPNTIFPVQKINFDYGEYFKNPEQNVIDEIKKQIFRPQYGEKMETLLHFYSRAIAGHNEDKIWASYLGNRNCGKGVEYELLKNAFGPYVSPFELDNVCYVRKTEKIDSGDCARKQYWLLDLEFVRLAISQETPDPKSGKVINSKIWKKMTGGGDTFVARRNFDRKDTHFVLETTFCSKGNNSLYCDTVDCDETRLEFESFIQYKSAEEIKMMREAGYDENTLARFLVGNANIKEECKKQSWMNAVIYLLYSSYKSNAVSIVREIDLEDDTLQSVILKNFVVTNNNDDVMSVAEVCQSLYDYDKGKIILELSSMNVFRKRYEKNAIPTLKKKWCFFGIKRAEIEKNIDDANTDNSYDSE